MIKQNGYAYTVEEMLDLLEETEPAYDLLLMQPLIMRYVIEKKSLIEFLEDFYHNYIDPIAYISTSDYFEELMQIFINCFSSLRKLLEGDEFPNIFTLPDEENVETNYEAMMDQLNIICALPDGDHPKTEKALSFFTDELNKLKNYHAKNQCDEHYITMDYIDNLDKKLFDLAKLYHSHVYTDDYPYIEDKIPEIGNESTAITGFPEDVGNIITRLVANHNLTDVECLLHLHTYTSIALHKEWDSNNVELLNKYLKLMCMKAIKDEEVEMFH